MHSFYLVILDLLYPCSRLKMQQTRMIYFVYFFTDCQSSSKKLTSLKDAILVRPENFNRNKAFSLQLVTTRAKTPKLKYKVMIWILWSPYFATISTLLPHSKVRTRLLGGENNKQTTFLSTVVTLAMCVPTSSGSTVFPFFCLPSSASRISFCLAST